MSEYRSMFKRKEVKYRLSSAQREAIERVVVEHLQVSDFSDTYVFSLYMDTKDRSLIARSLEKPVYKEKLRFRWYSSCDMRRQNFAAAQPFIEIKKKFNGVVYKRRTLISSFEINELFGRESIPLEMGTFADDDDKSALHNQIIHEVQGFISHHPNLMASALISYHRCAYEEPEELGLRVTFDDHLSGIDMFSPDSTRIKTQSRTPGITNFSMPEIQKQIIESSDESKRCVLPFEKLLLPDESIMEIKCSGPYPFWLVEILDATQAYPSSFSKYGELYKRGMMKHAG